MPGQFGRLRGDRLDAEIGEADFVGRISIATRKASLTRATIAALVPRGASSAYHVVAVYPGKPAAATVGTSGRASERLTPLTPSGRMRPERICVVAPGIVGMPIAIRPAIRSVIHWPTLRNGTCTTSMSAVIRRSSIARCPLVPIPVDP